MKFRTYRISEDLAKRAERVASGLTSKLSVNAVIEMSVEGTIALIEQQPGKRKLPPLVVLADEMRKYHEEPPPLGPQAREAAILNDRGDLSSDPVQERVDAEERAARAEVMRRHTRRT